MSNENDLASAIREASSAVDKSEQRKPKAHRSRTQIGNGPALLMIVVATTLMVSIIWQSSYRQSQSELDADLRDIVRAAQESVEAARKSTGELPPTIPTVALAGVVRYEPAGSEYRLIVQAKNRIARIEHDGSMHIEGAPTR